MTRTVQRIIIAGGEVRCNTCGERLPWTSINFPITKRGTLRRVCRACHNAAVRLRYDRSTGKPRARGDMTVTAPPVLVDTPLPPPRRVFYGQEGGHAISAPGRW